ncbi:EamA domain-containing membrane protein RarD [Albidovulum inexpectatum]|uniref:EamA domain-containing membrane protein RarD n=1 Tax=Albidovulum inexpectatum TaxID=196587 RepID=A0A2S5JFE6_9RHOB|nr:DMT family transporter [Albidovulum inexpectatum]PPB80236.1 EamA domain-containing membrane protein RarD [Albidovulum inexpectatum]
MSPLRGIAFKVASVCVFMAMASLVKAVSGAVPPGEVVFFRSAFAVPVILVWLLLTRGLREGLATRNLMGHFWRGLVGTAAMGCSFAALGLLPLPEATAIGYAAPLLTVVFAAMFLGENVRLFRIFTVALGMTGVVVILSPRMSALQAGTVAPTEALGALLALIGAVFAALAQVFVRKLVSTEKVSAIVFYFSINSALLSLLTVPFGWVWPDPMVAAMLVCAGILGGLGQVLLTSSYRFADASVVAPFEYVSMLLALVIGYVAFGETPTLVVLAGAALVMLAGILIILRERQLGLERARQRRAMTPQG